MPVRVSTSEMSNQKKLDFLVDAFVNGGPSMLYGASLIDLIDDLPRRFLQAPILRDGKKIALIQEIADAKTIGLRNEATLAALLLAVKQLATGQGTDPAAFQEAIESGVKSALDGLVGTATVSFKGAE